MRPREAVNYRAITADFNKSAPGSLGLIRGGPGSGWLSVRAGEASVIVMHRAAGLLFFGIRTEEAANED